MLGETKIGSKVRKFGLEARTSLHTATRKFEGEVEDQMRRMKVKERVSTVRDKVSKVKDKFGAIYREKASKVKAKFRGMMEDAKQSSRGIRGKIDSKMNKWRQRMREFYQERTFGPAQTYSCIGHQMRNFVLSSVLLQHVAFTVLLWRHWNKCEASLKNFSEQSGIFATVAIYWFFALLSMFSKGKGSLPQWLLYSLMSIPLVHMVPLKIVFFDFCLLLLTIALATVSVFDIYHRLYKDCLVQERAVLQDHLFMSLQATLLFLHIRAPAHATVLTGIVVIFSWRDFVSFFQLQKGQSFFSQGIQLVQTQIHQWIGIALANILWLSIVRLTSQIPSSLLHSHLGETSFSFFSLAFLAAEMTLFHCCIVIKYKIRYAKQDEEEKREEERRLEAEERERERIILFNIPAPPPLPPYFIRMQQIRQLQANQIAVRLGANAAEGRDGEGNLNNQDSDVSSLALLHPTVYWHYVWILGVICDFLMGLLDRLGYEPISQSLSLVLPVIILVAVLPIQFHYWNNKWNYDIPMCTNKDDHNHQAHA